MNKSIVIGCVFVTIGVGRGVQFFFFAKTRCDCGSKTFEMWLEFRCVVEVIRN